ncbi:MAG: 16S rRNA (guanine(527)-N(7))-methyltransferase RsmG [Kordiimonas sp.]|nr:16S rRNA (guanine(527)-N(7))-methyltransferase RsmG [Kordiimonas sp.]
MTAPVNITTFGVADLRQQLNVPRETCEKLEHYVATLLKWQKQINLISPSTVPEIWWRHIFDSAQLYALLPEKLTASAVTTTPSEGPLSRPLLDLGSGAGFPALVLAIMGWNDVHMIESNGKKAAFLRQIIRDLDLQAVVHHGRIEQISPFPVSVMTSRALASLEQLLVYAEGFLQTDTLCLLPKGRTAEDEVAHAARNWKFNIEKIASQTDPEGVILKLTQISRRGDRN